MFKKKNGGVRLARNFLVRTSPEFVKQGFAAAVVDAPSDQAGGMSAAFRTSPAHAQDLIKVIDFLDKQGLKPIFLAGTSRGTLSAAYLATVLADARIKGLVLTASLGEELSRLPLQNVTLPVLLVHHKDDACKISPFAGAVRLKGMFSKSPRVDLVEVQGGLPPESDPCRPMSVHGFLGKETEVVQAIADWLAGRPVPARIGP
jgi:pimeloyl-ACP methyl ester carboxylesterase